MAIIVVGGGAAGLMTARELGRAGKRVTILRDRWGGRIHLLPAAEFGCSAEGGAEFVYGEAPGLRAAVLSQRISCTDPLLGWSASRARHEDHAKSR